MKNRTWFTDFIVGKKVKDKLGSMDTSTSTRSLGSRELTQDVRNRIIFWISITGGVVQCANFAYNLIF